MRMEIGSSRTASYEGETFLDSDGFTDTPIRIKVTIRIEGDEAWVDFAGSDPQVTGFVNSPMANTATCVYVAFLTTVTTPDIPHNEGVYRPVHITAPEGSVVNPRFPAPGGLVHPGHGLRHPRGLLDGPLEGAARPGARGLEPVERPHHHRHRPAVERLLRHVRLQRVRRRGRHARAWTAGTTSATASTSAASSRRTSRPTRPTIPTSPSSTSSPPTPAARGSGGAAAGRSTGSRCYDENPTLVMFGDGKMNPPYGLFGGMPGSCNLAFINEGRPGQRELKAKETVQLKKGDTYTSYPSGGGGWGDPLERDPESVREDVQERDHLARAGGEGLRRRRSRARMLAVDAEKTRSAARERE